MNTERYTVVYSGPASTPWAVGIVDNQTGEKVQEHKINASTGTEIRKEYEEQKRIMLKECHILNTQASATRV